MRQGISLIWLALLGQTLVLQMHLEGKIGAMPIVENAKHAVAVGQAVVMVVMGRVVREEGHIIAAVRDDGVERRQAKPKPDDNNVRVENERPQKNGRQVRYQVFYRMGIESSHGHGGSELVMLLVDVFVDTRMVEQAVRIIEA